MNNLENVLKNSTLSEEVDERKGAEYQKNRLVEILYKSRLKFKNEFIFRLGIAQKRIKIYFYNKEMSNDLKINSPKRAVDIREFFYQDNIRQISDREYLKRLLKSCSDLLEIDESY